jgi:hypothetical protein
MDNYPASDFDMVEGSSTMKFASVEAGENATAKIVVVPKVSEAGDAGRLPDAARRRARVEAARATRWNRPRATTGTWLPPSSLPPAPLLSSLPRRRFPGP